ncbi:MAG: RDD family protein [Helicobacteraceae bacterium]
MDKNRIIENLQREDLSLASAKSRLLAFVADDFILSMIMFVGFYQDLGAATNMQDLTEILTGLLVYRILLEFFYHTIFVHLYGATPGKMWQKIIVVQADDFFKPALTKALLRSAVRIVSEKLLFYGFIFAFFSPLKQTWHDLASGTIVINA